MNGPETLGEWLTWLLVAPIALPLALILYWRQRWQSTR